MRAVRLHTLGDLDSLRIEEIETPRPQPGEALVEVHAAAITRDELEWPEDRLPAIPSYELSGVVAELGEQAEGVAVGDAVYALTAFDRDGAAAEYVAVPTALLAPKPSVLDDVESAAVPLAALSAWQGLFDHGALEAGQRVLIHGATGGVGHLATQLARWRGAEVIGTTSADSANFEQDLDPVDLVFDTVGGDLLVRSAAVLREGGRLVSVAEEPPAGTYFVVEPSREQLVELTRLIEAGDVRPAVDSVFPLSDARAAFERSLAAGKAGKVVLQVAQR